MTVDKLAGERHCQIAAHLRGGRALIVRPFNFDTLAVRVYQLASDERLNEAATGSLVIVAIGLVPIFLLTRFADRRDAQLASSTTIKLPQ